MAQNIIDQVTPDIFTPGNLGGPFSGASQVKPGGGTVKPITPAMPIGQFNAHVSASDTDGLPGFDPLNHPAVQAQRRQDLINYHQTFNPAPNVPRNYGDPFGPPQHFADSLGIHPDANVLRAQDAQNAAYGARNPTSPVADLGSPAYQARLGNSYQTAIQGFNRQNAQLAPPTSGEVSGAQSGLDALNTFDAAKRTNMGMADPMAQVYQSRAAGGQGPAYAGGVDPSVGLRTLQEQRGRDTADLSASQAARDPLNAVLDRNSLAGRLSSQNQTTANNASIDRLTAAQGRDDFGMHLENGDIFGGGQRTPAQQGELDNRRYNFAEQQDQKAANAQGAVTAQGQREQTIYKAIAQHAALAGIDPKVISAVIGAANTTVKANSNQTVAGIKANASTNNAVSRANATTQASANRANATTQAASTNAQSRVEVGKGNNQATTQAAGINAQGRVDAVKARQPAANNRVSDEERQWEIETKVIGQLNASRAKINKEPLPLPEKPKRSPDTQPSASNYDASTIHVNPSTGERIAYDGKSWVPLTAAA